VDTPDFTATAAQRLRVLNPPKTGTCRICGAPRSNDLHEGSSICSVVCYDCRQTMLGKRGKGKTLTRLSPVSMTGEKGVGKTHTASPAVLGMDEAFSPMVATQATHEPVFLRSYSQR